MTESTAKPYYQDSRVTIYHGDAPTMLESWQSNGLQVDHLISDPPYSEYTHSKQRTGDALADGYGRERELGFAPLSAETRSRVAAAAWWLVQRWALFFSDLESAHLWREDLEKGGMSYVRTGIWVRLNSTPQFTGDRPAQGAEAIVIMHQNRAGGKRWNGGGSAGVWTYPIVINRSGRSPRFHPTQKPVGLMEELIALFTDPGEVILDPFMGSGTTLRAAKDLGRRAIGIEQEEKWCAVAAERMAQASLAEVMGGT